MVLSGSEYPSANFAEANSPICIFLKTVESWIFVYTRLHQEIKLTDVFRADFSQITNRRKRKVFSDNFKSVTEPTI